jgi:serine-type D-Ala-D-Ala carboxypeptidase/endopeptidase (penicillin-binding protein 4)
VLCVASSSWASFAAQVDALAAAPELRYALVGALVVDLASGEELYVRNADVRMIPASNQKLITGAAAYELLGPEFRFVTRVLACGRPDREGRLRGSLYLRGGGDPSLAQAGLEDLAARLRAARLGSVEGGVVADASIFADEGPGRGWSWDYLDEHYAAEVSGLTVDEGCVTAIVRGAERAGGRPELRLEPPSDILSLAADATTSETSAEPGLYRALGSNTVGLRGALGVGAEVAALLTVRSPALYAGTLLRRALEQEGVAMAGRVKVGRAPPEARELVRLASVPLREVLLRLNKDSDNATAEALLRALSMDAEGVGSRERSAALLDRWVEALGGDARAYVMADGSGLSRLNLVTPRLLVQVLRHMAGCPGWLDTLPVMGVDGTLAGRLKGTPVEGKVRGKTGYVSGVRALSGYAQAQSGRRLAFSILVNGALDTSAAGRFQDEVCELMVGL